MQDHYTSTPALLARILGALGPVSFKETLNIPKERKLTRSHRRIVAVQKVRDVASNIGLGLIRVGPFFYLYDGDWWRQVEESEIVAFLPKAAERLGVEEGEARDYVFTRELLDQTGVSWLTRMPERENGTVLINLTNGTYEINGKGGHLRGKRREDILTYQLPFKYDPEARAPKWEAFLAKVLPDPTLQDICAEFIAYCFTDLKIEKVLLLLGGGANGKSVFFDSIKAMLGEGYVSHVGIKELDEPYYRTLLVDKLLNYSSELSTHMNIELFKKMSSGEPVIARLPYGKPFTMTRYARLAFNANDLPKDVENNEAYFRRFVIVPFDVVIPEEERNPRLAREIIEEDLPGIFNWVLRGLDRLLAARGFSESDAVRAVERRFRLISDSVEMFIKEEGIIIDNDGREKLTDLYDNYKVFCRDNRYQALGKIHFSNRLERLGFPKFISNGIRFRAAYQQLDDEEAIA